MTDIFPDVDAVEAESDWLTALTENEMDGAALRAVGERYLALAERVRAWHMRGYHGRQGSDLRGLTGGIAYGEKLSNSDPSFILQSWGQASARIGKSLLAYHHMRVSRMDYAVTVLFSKELPPVKLWPIGDESDLKWNVTRIVPSGSAGGTLYVGSRGSDMFGRVYDKGAQLGTVPERLYWRWEIEYKGECAKRAFASYTECVDPAEASRFIASEVSSWYQEHGIPIPTLRDAVMGRPVIRYATRVRVSETTIKWLHQQVAPALRKLDYDGRLDDALDALGLFGGQTFMPFSETNSMNIWEQTTFLRELQDGSDLTSLQI